MEAFGAGHERLEIHAALAKVATSVESDPTDAAWVLRVGGSKRGLDVAARWEDELLLVDAPFPSLGESDWSYLEATGRFAGGAKLILADEPTGNLDPANKFVVLDLLLDYAREEGATLLAVTHDHDLLDRFDRVLDFNAINAWSPA